MAANYSADIRIGITGKAGLNNLEKQLKRVNAQVNKLNKALVLKTRAQTIKLNTKGANAAIKQLEDRINRLGRTVTVNLRAVNQAQQAAPNNQAAGAPSGSVNSAGLAAAARTTIPDSELERRKRVSEKLLADAKERVRDGEVAQAQSAKILETYNQLETVNQELVKAQTAYANKTEQIADLTRKRNAALGQAKALQTKLSKGQIKNADAVKRAKVQMAEYKTLASDLSAQIGNANKGFGNQNRLLEKANRLRSEFVDQEKKLERLVDSTARKQERAKKIRKGFGAGGGVAAASAVGNLPIVGDAATGGLVAGLSGGSIAAGAFAGALVGVVAGAVAATAEVTKFNNAIQKQQRALANTVATNEEYAQALRAVENAGNDFLVPIGDATQQFTKLNAAARSSGFTVAEVEEVYRGLAAANVALGGDTERLNGILLATQQVFSKGKVQAEELRGQIGERLPGAFAKFAAATGRSTQELDKALNDGEVSLDDFVTFARSLLEEYEEDAKKIADAPENAGQRLKKAMDDLKIAMGPILQDIGNAFIKLANTVVKQLTRMFEYINKARLGAADARVEAARENFNIEMANLKEAEKAYKENSNFFTKFMLDRATTAALMAKKTLDIASKVRNDIVKPFDVDPTGNPVPDKPTPITEDKVEKEIKSRSKGIIRAEDLFTDQAYAELQQRISDAVLASERAITEAMAAGDDARVQKLQDAQKLIPLAAEISALENIMAQQERYRTEQLERGVAASEIDEQIMRVKNQLQLRTNDLASEELKIKQDAIQRDREQQELQAELNKAFEQEVRDLQLALDLELATSDAMREQLRLKAALNAIDNMPDRTDSQKEQLKSLERRLAAARDGNTGLSGYMKQLQEELGDTEAMIISLSQTVVSELSTAMSTAIVGLIDGTKTAQEAFAEMFSNIGKAFIDMATQMIAKALVLKALGILFPGAASSPGYGGVVGGRGPQFFGPAFDGGGYTGNGARSGGVDGKGGFPAILHPQETVIDHHSAMGRYSGAGSAGGGSRTIRFESTVINNVEYVTVDQAMAMSRAAADDGARRGAAGGHTRSMTTLKNSRSQRSKLGMR